MLLDFSSLRVLIVGDVILDRYVEGSVGRMSPEAPVAVLRRRTERDVLGGAANVAANLASLGAQARLVGLTGRDENRDRLARLATAFPALDIGGLVPDPARPTTCKSRVVSGLHQIVRIDTESTDPALGEIEAALLAAIVEGIGWADVVVLSDYAKGVCTDRVIRIVIEAAAKGGKPSVVDPKRQDFAIYGGATLIKPNRRELAEATRLPCQTDAEAEAAARAVIAETRSAVLLTRSEQGISFFGTDGEVLHLPTASQEVFDVSGAGDTVLALAALGLGAHLPKMETMRLANIAAGIVVGKVGTAVVTRQELSDALDDLAHRASFAKGELVDRAGAIRHREHWRRLGLRVGFTNGCFDLLHPGHVRLLRAAAGACDRLIVALNSDASVRRLKGPSRPVQDAPSRAEVLGALEAVDLVVVFDEDTPAEAIAALQPDILVKGADYTEEQVVGADVVRAAGGRVLLVPVVAGQSTTAMIRRGLAES